MFVIKKGLKRLTSKSPCYPMEELILDVTLPPQQSKQTYFWKKPATTPAHRCKWKSTGHDFSVPKVLPSVVSSSKPKGRTQASGPIIGHF